MAGNNANWQIAFVTTSFSMNSLSLHLVVVVIEAGISIFNNESVLHLDTSGCGQFPSCLLEFLDLLHLCVGWAFRHFGHACARRHGAFFGRGGFLESGFTSVSRAHSVAQDRD